MGSFVSVSEVFWVVQQARPFLKAVEISIASVVVSPFFGHN
jgi:hypothetical protein